MAPSVELEAANTLLMAADQDAKPHFFDRRGLCHASLDQAVGGDVIGNSDRGTRAAPALASTALRISQSVEKDSTGRGWYTA